MNNIHNYEILFRPESKQLELYCVLKDKKWHCRNHAYTKIKSIQIAGGGGIQGLERGTMRRSGLKLERRNKHCQKCRKIVTHDRWTGKFIPQTPASTLSIKAQTKILKYYKYMDVVDQRKRLAKDLTIDHKFPLIRWQSNYGQTDKNIWEVDNDVIQKRFQLLKKSIGSVNHNLLKSRACEKCYKHGTRGTPFGIQFFYKGYDKWGEFEKTDEHGCEGCGWYDFAKWRDKLNEFIKTDI